MAAPAIVLLYHLVIIMLLSVDCCFLGAHSTTYMIGFYNIKVCTSPFDLSIRWQTAAKLGGLVAEIPHSFGRCYMTQVIHKARLSLYLMFYINMRIYEVFIRGRMGHWLNFETEV